MQERLRSTYKMFVSTVRNFASNMQMKSMQKLLAVKGGHVPPQPQVLASIVGSHSRLGSITDHIAKAMPHYTPIGRLFNYIRPQPPTPHPTPLPFTF